MSSASDSDEHAKSFWEHHWDAFDGTWSERDLARAHTLCSLVPQGISSVLEVGCGDGLIINRVAAPDTMGTDISAVGLGSVTGPSLQCSSDDLPFEDRRYELVIASEVLEHLPEGVYQRSLCEIARVAGNHILISVPNREYLKANVTRCPACGGEYHRNMHQRCYRPRDLEGLFEGFDTAVRSEIGEKELRRGRLEVFVRRLVGASPPPWGTVCPHCGTAHERSDREEGDSTDALKADISLPKKVKRRLSRHRKPWLVALYTRAAGRSDINDVPS